MDASAPNERSILEEEYARTLLEYVSGAGELALSKAYEIGRRAGIAQIGLLDLVQFHQSTAAALLRNGSIEPGSPLPGQFLAEALSPYEMSLRAFRESSRLLGLAGELARNHEETHRAREQLRAILDATTAVIYLRDANDRFLFVNRQFEIVFGVSREQVLSRSGAEILPASIEATLRPGDRAALESRSPQELEETLPFADGPRTYLSLKFPLLDESDVPYAVCCVATDISERKRAAEAIRIERDRADAANRELREAQAQLVHSAKMASLGELVAGVAHEINNPLAFALAHLETVKKILLRTTSALDRAGAPEVRSEFERAQERLRETQGGLERIRDLVLKLRAFSRLDEGERKVVSFRENLDSVVTILGHRIKHRVALELELEAPDRLDCYPSLLNQALLNVLANALDAIEERGTIVVRTEARDGTYHISIEDSGPGIPSAVRQRVFEPFFTTKPPGKGTGLGLSITYAIVERHGGRLSIDCPDRGGTIVRLSLPAAAGSR
ncbi:MAG TPA: ATP-binding protein [Polyangiaceae bacterium]|nr:ATP-binding protein [Polyangiaceae bacterium]